ncbi:hypothetical protein [Bacteroides sp.]|nr:hypothetical protein [Bacteroides sp.]MDD3040625.1 hypothetical protein [Bacteroides sp.]
MEQGLKEKALTMQELITLINNAEEDFLISISLGEEADTNGEKE